MKRSKYERKKVLLKRIKNEWGRRMDEVRHYESKRFCGPVKLDSRLSWSELVGPYCEAQHKIRRFINNSIYYRNQGF